MMTFPYLMRLALLSMAAFSLVYTTGGAFVAILAPAAIRTAKRTHASRGAGLLLAMRLAPALCGLLTVILFCIPSYLWLETDTGAERVGLFCLAAACCGAAAWTNAIIRTIHLILRSQRWTTNHEGPVLALAGVIRPRVIISSDMRNALCEDHLNAALKHEDAHRRAHDNLKRLLISVVPRMPGMAALESGWATAAEWAADDYAVQGDAEQAVTLAGALVQAARLGACAQDIGLATSFAASGRDLEARVARLLNGNRLRERPLSRLTVAAGCFAAGCAALLTLRPSVFLAVHELLELFTY